MKLSRFLIAIVVIGLAVSGGHAARAQCAAAYVVQACSTGLNFSCSTQSVVPVQDWSYPGFEPIMGSMDCCGEPVPTMTGSAGECYYTELREQRTQERLAQLSARSPVYVPTCDGWLRPFHRHPQGGQS